MTRLLTEAEIYQQVMEALERAKAEGQPVQEIYEAIRAGGDVEITLKPASTGKVQLIISV